MTRQRPIGVTILAILVGLGAVMAIIHMLQMLHLWPTSLGSARFFNFEPFGALMWGVLAAIYIWLLRKLWNLDPQAWIYLILLAGFTLLLDLFSVLGASTWQSMLPSILIGGFVLIYCLMPGTKAAFGISR